MFYHPDGERGRARAQRENRAKAICHTCPVIAACREHALKVAEPYGIWGGLSESERLSVLRNRGARPGRQKGRVAAAPSRPTVNA
jgi:WhiB family redox-sensing transcriptional regulator